MTNIYLNSHGNEYTMIIDGHAGYGAHGSDILCASISMMAQSFVYYVEALEDDAEAYFKYIDMKSGYIKCVAIGDLEEPFRMLRIGLEQIAEQYPDYVRMGKKRE